MGCINTAEFEQRCRENSSYIIYKLTDRINKTEEIRRYYMYKYYSDIQFCPFDDRRYLSLCSFPDNVIHCIHAILLRETNHIDCECDNEISTENGKSKSDHFRLECISKVKPNGVIRQYRDVVMPTEKKDFI